MMFCFTFVSLKQVSNHNIYSAQIVNEAVVVVVVVFVIVVVVAVFSPCRLCGEG